MTLAQITKLPAATTAYGFYEFGDLALAYAFAERATKRMLIVLGDNGRLWVVTPAVASRLANAGYQIA